MASVWVNFGGDEGTLTLKITSLECLEFVTVAGFVVLEKTFSSRNGPGSRVITNPRRSSKDLGSTEAAR
jgi:hypothetical protein